MKLSVITINYNNSKDLERTIQSVVNQTWKGFEYIIIDGGSNDESVEMLNKYNNQIDFWVSEKDKGVFNAMNKGIEKAVGEYLLMLNSGDILHDNNTLEKIFGQEKYTEDIIYGEVLRESQGEIFAESVFPNKLDFDFLRSGAISHQAAYIKKAVHGLAGLYDEKMKFSSDWAFVLVAVCTYNATTRHLPFVIAVCNCDGLTCNPANFPAMDKERDEFLQLKYPAFIDFYRNDDRRKQKTIRHRSTKIYKKIKNYKHSLGKILKN